jgi:hypothetical protein
MTTWRDRCRWRKELRNVPLDQLRGMVRGSHFYAIPEKQRWAERWLWRREHADKITIIGLVIGLGSLIVAAVGLYLKG